MHTQNKPAKKSKDERDLYQSEVKMAISGLALCPSWRLWVLHFYHTGNALFRSAPQRSTSPPSVASATSTDIYVAPSTWKLWWFPSRAPTKSSETLNLNIEKLYFACHMSVSNTPNQWGGGSCKLSPDYLTFDIDIWIHLNHLTLWISIKWTKSYIFWTSIKWTKSPQYH